jgi:tRNA modification GTPase
VGKSTLLHALTGKARAIVSATAGTTRDFLEESLLIGGIPVCLVDTAGIQDALEDVEAQGVSLARRQLEAADLVLWVVDASRFGDGKEPGIALPADRTLLVLNKIDLVAGHPLEDVQSGVEANLSSNHVVSSENTGRWPAATALGDGSQPGSRSPSTGSASHSEPNRLLPAIVPTFVAVSALTGSGMERLRQAMLDRLTSGKMDLDSRAVITNVRHRTALERCLQALERARAHLGASEPAGDLLAQDLRLALRALGDILGETTGEDILGRIFERFCVGK